MIGSMGEGLTLADMLNRTKEEQMKKYGLFLGLLLSTALMASQALAATVTKPSGISVPSTDSDGQFNVTIGASSTAGVTYELYENDIVIYSGTVRKFLVTGRIAGSYDYKVNAIKVGMDPSPFTATKTSLITGNGLPQVVAPTGIAAIANDTDGMFSVSIGSSSTTDALYNFEESIDGGAFTPVLTNSTSRQYLASGKLSGKKYSYRAYASKAGMSNSAYTATTTTFVASSDYCITCHSNGGAGTDNNTAWAVSRHSNSNTVPAVSYTNSCGQCHSPTTELANGAMAVTCLGCHSYNGTDIVTGHPVVNQAAAIASCAECHNSHYSTANNIVTKVNGGKHSMSASTHGSAGCAKCHTIEGYLQFRAGQTVTAGVANVSCAACHDPHTANLRDTQYALCTSCHQTSGFYHDSSWSRNIMTTHNDDSLTSTIIEGYVVRTGSDNPCLDCHAHEFLTETGNLSRTTYAGFDAAGVAKNYYGYNKNATHATTLHTDWAMSAHAGGLLNAKYAAQEAYPKIASIVDGQGTILATGTYDFAAGMTTAVKLVGVTDSEIGNAWAHYDWDKTFKADGTDAGTDVDKDRADCQQCHTSTGNANFMKAQANSTTYNPALNNFSHLSGWAGSLTTVTAGQTITTSSKQNELLYCWGCHSSVESGALIAPLTTGIKPGYKVNDVALQLPSLGTSNACVGCHSGRGNIQSLLTTAPTGGIDPTVALTTSTVPKSTATATSTHYLNAAATILKDETKVGYEFPSLNYADPVYFKHNTIGCVDCHMTTANSHSFEVVTKDGAGVITAINSQATCNTCHTTYPIDAAKLEEEKLGFEEALHAFEHELQLKGYVFVNAHPYFYVGTTSGADLFYKSPSSVSPTVYSTTATDRNGDTVIDGLDWIDVAPLGTIDAADMVNKKPATWAKQGDIGAGHNFNYLHHEPGAYAHNRFYSKRLIFDSIDWLDNNSMDGTITIDADTYPEAALWFGATAPAVGSFVATRP